MMSKVAEMVMDIEQDLQDEVLTFAQISAKYHITMMSVYAVYEQLVLREMNEELEEYHV
jgi:hypothetical protein